MKGFFKMMKPLLSLFTLCACFFFADPAAAQTGPFDPGSMIISGSFCLSTREFDGTRVTSVGLAPGLNYFIKPGLAIGGSVSVSATFRENNTSTSLGLGPQLIYFFNAPSGPDVAGIIVPFIEGSLFYNRSTSKVDTSTLTRTTNQDNFNAVIGAGGMYMMNTAVGLFLKAEAAFSHTLNDDSDLTGDRDDTMSTFGLTGGLTIFLP
jgi:hypothetical protein